MLNHVIDNTMEFFGKMPKSKRKKKGQFFMSVETARFMATINDFA